jgi:hypothetical protein
MIIALDHPDSHAIDDDPSRIAVVGRHQGVAAGGTERAYKPGPKQARLSFINFDDVFHRNSKQTSTDKGFGE